MTLRELEMNIEKNEVKNIRVFSRKVAIELRQKAGISISTIRLIYFDMNFVLF